MCPSRVLVGIKGLRLLVLVYILSFADAECKSYTDKELAIRFAPIFKFDGAAPSYGYPMDIQVFLDNGCVGAECQNHILNTVSNPTYYRVTRCNDGNFDIEYSSFYAYQEPCLAGQGSHNLDIEDISVHIDSYCNVKRVRFGQHGGYYEVSSSSGDLEMNGEHPVTYVAKIAHGFYYDSNDFGGGCRYFYDYRSPIGQADWLYTENNLIDVRSSSDNWIVHGVNDPYFTVENLFDGSDGYLCGEESCSVLYKDDPDYCGCDELGCNYEYCDSTWDLMINAAWCVAANEEQHNVLPVESIQPNKIVNIVNINMYLFILICAVAFVVVNIGFCVLRYCKNVEQNQQIECYSDSND